MFTDDRGRPLRPGDHVVATATDTGTPLAADRGVVAGFGRVRVRVQWTAWGYDERMPYHAVATVPSGPDRQAPSLRRLEP